MLTNLFVSVGDRLIIRLHVDESRTRTCSNYHNKSLEQKTSEKSWFELAFSLALVRIVFSSFLLSKEWPWCFFMFSLGNLCQMWQTSGWMSNLSIEYRSCCSRFQIVENAHHQHLNLSRRLSSAAVSSSLSIWNVFVQVISMKNKHFSYEQDHSSSIDILYLLLLHSFPLIHLFLLVLIYVRACVCVCVDNPQLFFFVLLYISRKKRTIIFADNLLPSFSKYHQNST